LVEHGDRQSGKLRLQLGFEPAWITRRRAAGARTECGRTADRDDLDRQTLRDALAETDRRMLEARRLGGCAACGCVLRAGDDRSGNAKHGQRQRKTGCRAGGRNRKTPVHCLLSSFGASGGTVVTSTIRSASMRPKQSWTLAAVSSDLVAARRSNVPNSLHWRMIAWRSNRLTACSSATQRIASA